MRDDPTKEQRTDHKHSGRERKKNRDRLRKKTFKRAKREGGNGLNDHRACKRGAGLDAVGVRCEEKDPTKRERGEMELERMSQRTGGGA